MHIADLETFRVGTHPPHKGGRNWFFVKLTTDDGIEGWGECTKGEFRLDTLDAAFAELKEHFLVGHDPFEIETLRRKLYGSLHNLHIPGPVLSQVVAAAEMACWDIVGKRLDQPVYNLLGGRHNDRIRTYTYIHYKWRPPDPPEDAATAAREYLDRGFTGVKIDPISPISGPRTVSLAEIDYAEEVIAAIREEVGDQMDILVGTHGQFDTATAVRFARRLEQYDPLWFEEPVPPENVGEMAAVAEKTTIPVATGERVTTQHTFAELLGQDAAGILQPDLGLLGILQAKKVAGMAESQYVQVAPWHYCGPIQGAAAVQLDVSTPNFLIQESIEDWGACHNELLEEPMEWTDGYIVPPDRPGLGVVPDEDAIADHARNDPVPLEEQPAYWMDAAKRTMADADDRFV